MRVKSGGVLALISAILFDPSPIVLLGESLFVLVIADFILGSVRALLSHDWSVVKCTNGVKKLVWWATVIIFASFLRAGLGLDFDWVLRHLGDLMVFCVVFAEVTSILQNLSGIAFLLGVNAPWLNKVIDIFEKWGAEEENEKEESANAFHRGESDDPHSGRHDDGRPGGDSVCPGPAHQPEGESDHVRPE